jgi:hypothetical protein
MLMLFFSSCITIGVGREKQHWNKSSTEITEDTEIAEDNGLVTIEREVQPFTGVNVTTGIVVVVSQSDETKVEVCADKDLQSMVQTNVHDGILKVYLEGRNSHSRKITVYVKTPTLTSLESSVGSNIKIGEPFHTDEISVGASSGSLISAELDAKKIVVSTGSGAIVSLKGTALYLDASSSSGSILKTVNLKADVCMIHVSSGSVCKINSVKEIHGHVSSGGIVTDYGSAQVEDVQASSGGLFRHKVKD